MACTIYKPRPMTLGESFKIAGIDDSELRRQGRENEMMDHRDAGLIFSCGSGPADPVCRCSHLADKLCDWPMGRGKTCDAPMCPLCSFNVGDDRDLCDIHWHMFTKKTGVRRMFPVTPRIVK